MARKAERPSCPMKPGPEAGSEGPARLGPVCRLLHWVRERLPTAWPLWLPAPSEADCRRSGLFWRGLLLNHNLLLSRGWSAVLERVQEYDQCNRYDNNPSSNTCPNHPLAIGDLLLFRRFVCEKGLESGPLDLGPLGGHHRCVDRDGRSRLRFDLREDLRSGRDARVHFRGFRSGRWLRTRNRGDGCPRTRSDDLAA